VIDRLFRHSGRFVPAQLQKGHITSGLAIFFGTAGGVALILLSNFDVPSHESQSKKVNELGIL
jgi:hypothetical protein